MDSHGPQEPSSNIFELTQTLQRVLGLISNLAGNSNFFNTFVKPYYMGVYGLP